MAMDQVYALQYKHTTSIQSSFDTFSRHLGAAKTIPADDDGIKAAMRFPGTDNQFCKLYNSISLQYLAHTDDIRPSPFDPSKYQNKRKNDFKIPKQALQLGTVATVVKNPPRMHYGHLTRYMKHNKYVAITSPVDKNAVADLQPNAEMVILVRVYEPFRFKTSSFVQMKPKLSQRFVVLASQMLTELRDRIYCQCKFGPFYDISNDPNAPEPDDTATKPFDHGFFYVYDTFYNDMREPTLDYSEPIRKWAATQPEIGEFKVANMETTRFIDLTIRLGSPCVYQHHGNCEHLFTISDIRLITRDDSLVRNDYPILNMVSIPKTLFCMICGKHEASIVVTDNTVHIHDPSYLCQVCFESYHYIDGKKVGEFRAYRYYGNKPVISIGK